jgi:hypothetical protein
MLYNTQDYWAFELCPSPDILENTTFREIDLFQSPGDGIGDSCNVGSIRKTEDGNR